MTERERLMDLIVKAVLPLVGEPIQGPKQLEMTADFLLKNGVILPPCKIGDEVYRISKRYGCWVVLPRYVSALTYRGGKWWDVFTTTNDMLGSTVFLTREEAEEAIWRRKKVNTT